WSEAMSFPGKGLRVSEWANPGPALADATDELELVFRLTEDRNDRWRLAEIRTGQDRWEELDVIAQAGKFELPKSNCDPLDEMGRVIPKIGLKGRQARCLVASLFGVDLPSDAVRIKEVLDLAVPLATENYGL